MAHALRMTDEYDINRHSLIMYLVQIRLLMTLFYIKIRVMRYLCLHKFIHN